MRRRTAIIVVAVVVLVAGLAASLAAVFRPFDSGPRYKAMPVAYWSKAIKEEFGGRSSLSRKMESWCGLSRAGQPAILDGDPGGVPVLLRLQEDKDEDVRIRAHMGLLKVLIGSGAREAIPALRSACADDNPDIRGIASRYLQIIEARKKTEP